MLPDIQKRIQQNFSSGNDIIFSRVGGGCINECYKVASDQYQLFCKVNSAHKFPLLFQKELNGLQLIGKQNVIKVPVVIDHFEINGKQVLLLQWITEGERTKNFWKTFGEQLAALHRVTNNSFGLDEDNFMGSVVQHNTSTPSWIDFFLQQRLQPLVTICLQKNLLSANSAKPFDNLYKKLPTIFNEAEKPSLLHGDLWSGNFMCNEKGEPVLIDPAVYYGHRSIDLAMTNLFGGFPTHFYEAYQYHYSLPANYIEQWKVCNLYPLLIHLLLFGKSYLPQIEDTLSYFSL